MPTEPLKSILYPEFSKAEAQKYIDDSSKLLREVVNYSTNLFARCQSSAKGEENEDAAIFALFRHHMEITDGIEVLVSQACGVPSVPLVRSSFETLLSIQFILEEPDEYENRALAWLNSYIHEKIFLYEMLDPNIDRGRQFYKSLTSEQLVSGIESDDLGESLLWKIDSQEISMAISKYKGVLKRSQFDEIEQQRQKLKTRRPNWYQLCGGPSNLREFARSLGREGQYDFLYRKWSSISHATDFSLFASATQGGERYIQRLRDPSQLKDIVMVASVFMLDSIRLLTMKFRPGEKESQARWYKAEIMSLRESVDGYEFH